MNKRVGTPKREPSELAKRLRAEFLAQGNTLNVADVAHVIDRDESTVLRLIRSGDLPAVKRGREYEIAESDLREYTERLARKQREQARIKQITREVAENYEHIRSTPAAQYWAYLTCINCGRSVLYKNMLGGEEDDTPIWSVTCPYCGEESAYDCDEEKSIAEKDKEAERAGDLVRDPETGRLIPNPNQLDF